MVITLAVTIILLIIGLIFNYYRNQTFRENTERIFTGELSNINTTFNEIYRDSREQVQASVDFAAYYLKSRGEIRSQPNTFKMDAVNQLTQRRSQVVVNQWNIGSKIIHYNNALAKNIGKFTDTRVAFLQKIPRGYIRIATSIEDEDAGNAIGTYIPNSSVVVETVERGQTYKGTAYVFNAWYHTAYIPLTVNGQIKGMLFVGQPLYDKPLLQTIFANRDYADAAQFMMIDEQGRVLVGKDNQRANLSQTASFTKMKALGSKVRHFTYQKSDYQGNETQFIRFYKYNPDLETFLVLDANVSALKERSVPLFYALVLPSVVVIIIFAVMISIFSRSDQQRLEIIRERNSKLARGIIPKKFKQAGKDEIGSIIQSLNALIDGYSNTVNFATEIKKGNLEADYQTRDEGDSLGNSLLEMRNSLLEAQKNERKRQEANENQQWLNEGIAHFSDILRKENKDVKQLAYNVISELVKYLHATQGGFFIVETDENNEQVIRLYASYAYEKERMFQKTINWGEGLIGRTIQEQKLLHITEIPEDYSDISSGLGSGKPQALLFFPLVANEQALGAVELGAFSDFTQTQINFMEKIAESIAITLITVQSNIKTEQLLENSKKQAEELSSQEEEMRQNLEELQATQESAARREKEMESIIEALNATNLVIHFDINGVIQDVNQYMLDQLGASEDEIVGLTIDYLIPAPQKEKHITNWEQVKQGEMVQQEAVYVYRNNKLQVQETLAPIADQEGNFYKVLSISSKIKIENIAMAGEA